MKNYDELTNDLLERRDRYVADKKRKRKRAMGVATSLCCFCLVALLGFGMWQGGVFDAKPPVITGEQTLDGDNSNSNVSESTGTNEDKQNQGGQTSTSGNNDEQNNISTGKELFAINEITGTIGAALKYRDPAFHYNEIWDVKKTATYLGVSILEVVEKLPDGDAEAGFAKAFNFRYVTVNGFKVVYENNGTLVEDRMCYEFAGDNNAKIMILVSKLGMPYDCLYSSDTDDVTNIRIPETDEIIPVRVYAQGKMDTTDYTLYVGDFEYNGVFYRIRLENLTGKHLDALIREIVK